MEQKKKEEEQNYKEKERFVGEGSGKNNTMKEQEQEADADTESLTDWQSAWDEYFEERRKEIAVKNEEMEEKQIKQEKEEEIEEGQIEEEDDQDIQDDDTLKEPNFIRNESKETGWGKCYFRALEHDPLFGKDKKIRHPFYANEDKFILQRHPSQGQNRVYIPDGKLQIGREHYYMRTLLIHAAHHCHAHYGVTKTYRDLLKDTFWPGQWEETKKFVESCNICQRIKQPTQRPAETAKMIQILERPFQSICIDIIGPFPPSQGYKYALVVVDRFSSFIRIVPRKKKFNTRDIVEVHISKIYCYHGMPQEIISDRGPQIVSNYFTELHKAFGVHLSPSTAFHQQTNGSAERAIKTIAQVHRAYVNSKQTNWLSQL